MSRKAATVLYIIYADFPLATKLDHFFIAKANFKTNIRLYI